MQPLAVSTILGQADPAAGLAGFLPFILIAVLFYFVLIRPQQKRVKQQRQLVASVEVHDRVVTIGGMHGTVRSLDDETMRLEISPGTIVTMTRQAIARKLIDADTAAGEADAP